MYNSRVRLLLLEQQRAPSTDQITMAQLSVAIITMGKAMA